MSGWIKIHRKVLEWEWFDDTNTFKLFMFLILSVNHKDRNYKGKLIKAGSMVTGRELLAKQTNLSVQQIRTCLERLKSTNEITIETTTQGTIIQVVKYKDYQVLTNESTNDQPTINQQVTTNKNDKKEKKTIPTEDEFVAYGLSLVEDASIEAIKLKYKSWLVNDWCTNRNGKKTTIKNWKSTLSNTMPYIPKETKQIKSMDDQLYENVMKKLNG